jgi:hypothetical protein
MFGIGVVELLILSVVGGLLLAGAVAIFSRGKPPNDR